MVCHYAMKVIAGHRAIIAQAVDDNNATLVMINHFVFTVFHSDSYGKCVYQWREW